jgi:chitodextrinase
MPPTVPTNVVGTASREPVRVELAWTASTDAASAISYRVYRNGAHVGTTATTAWTNTAVAPATTYTYTVRALDAAGNLGAASPPVTVTTPSDTPEQTFLAVEDAYVRSNAAGENTGSASTVRVYRSGSTETHSYLKFVVSGVSTVSRATLRLYVTRSSPTGGTVFAGASSDWSEQTLTWQSKPAAAGSALASAGAVTAGQWIELDVSGLVRGPGTYTLVLKDGTSSAAWYASKESAQPPQLVTR